MQSADLCERKLRSIVDLATELDDVSCTDWHATPLLEVGFVSIMLRCMSEHKTSLAVCSQVCRCLAKLRPLDPDILDNARTDLVNTVLNVANIHAAHSEFAVPALTLLQLAPEPISEDQHATVMLRQFELHATSADFCGRACSTMAMNLGERV